MNPNEKLIINLINRAKENSIPILFLGISTDIVEKVSGTYSKAAFITPNSEEVGMTEGQILVNLWNTDKKIWI